MGGGAGRIPWNHRILTWENREIECSRDPTMSLSDTIFEFLAEKEQVSLESITLCDDRYCGNEGLCEDEERGDSGHVEVSKNYWEMQHQLLQNNIRKTSSLESRIRQATKDALKRVQMVENLCSCRSMAVSGGCRNCLMKEVSRSLQTAGFNCAICKSKWRSSPDIPSGEHSFLDVLDNSNPKKGEVRVIIELNLRAEFEMSKAGGNYIGLVEKLPELFVGKEERLLSLIKILCSASKKCMKEKKMHIGPWRRQKYMQAKWLSTCERVTSVAPPLSTAGYGDSRMTGRPRASMLTVDLLGTMPNFHHPAVRVV